MMVDRQKKCFHSLVLLLFLNSLAGVRSFAITDCQTLCSINRTKDIPNCLMSCTSEVNQAIPSNEQSKYYDNEDNVSEENINAERTGLKKLDNIIRTTRSADTVQFMGPYQRRPHYLRIGRAAPNPYDYKRGRASHYMRIGRSANDAAIEENVDIETFNEDKRSNRKSHYLRIGRAEDLPQALALEDEVDKRAKPSHYLRIGRSAEEMQILDYEKRAKPSHYLRIGRDAGNFQSDDVEKRAKPSHYLRIGRDMGISQRILNDYYHKRAKPSYYLRIGRSGEGEDTTTEYMEKRAKPSHYLRIGRGSLDDEDEMVGEELEKRARPSQYLRIGRGTEDGLSSTASNDAAIGIDSEAIRNSFARDLII